MTVGTIGTEVEHKVGQTGYNFEVVANLNDRNTEDALSEAMRKPDGVVPAEVVAAYLIKTEADHERQVKDFEEKIKLLTGELNSKVEQLYAIYEKLDRLSDGHASAVADLVEVMNSLEKTADNATLPLISDR